VVTRVGEYFVQIRQNDYQSLKIQFMCLKVNVCLEFQQNPVCKWYRLGKIIYVTSNLDGFIFTRISADLMSVSHVF